MFPNPEAGISAIVVVSLRSGVSAGLVRVAKLQQELMLLANSPQACTIGSESILYKKHGCFGLRGFFGFLKISIGNALG